MAKTVHLQRTNETKYKGLNLFKPLYISVFLVALTLTAVAESNFIMATGFAGSTDQSEATAKAIDEAESNLDAKCDGGRLSNISTSVHCDRSGNAQFGYTYYCTATKSAQCEKKGDEQQ